MTLRYVDGFDYIPLGSSGAATFAFLERARYYNQGDLNYTPSSTTAFSSGNSLVVNADVFDNGSSITDLCYVHVNEEDDQEGVLGCRIYVGSANEAYAWPDVGFYDAVNNTRLITVALQANGIIAVYRGRAGGSSPVLLIRSRPGVYRDQDWFYLEVKCKIANTGGYVQVRVNTVVVIDLVSADTQAGSNAYFDSYFIGGEAKHGESLQNLNYYIDDLYYLDLAGTENNDYRGNVRVKTQFLAADGDNIDFSRVGAATNWQAASNTAIDDTKYVYSGTAGDYDLYDISATLNSPLVHGVQVKGAYRQDDATQRIAHNIIKTSGGVESEGTVDHYLNQTYTFYWDIWELNPETGVGWTGAEVNGLQIGPKVDT